MKQYLADLPATTIWFGGLLTIVLVTIVITLLINPIMTILTIPIIIGMSVYIFSDSAFKSVNPDTVLVTKNVVTGTVGFLPAGLNMLHPFEPLTGEEISLKLVTKTIEKVILDCKDGIRLVTSLTVSYKADVGNLENYYVQSSADSIPTILKQKITSMLSVAKEMDSDNVMGEGQEDIIALIQDAFDDNKTPDPTNQDSVNRHQRAIRTEHDTGIQVIRIDFGDTDYADSNIIEIRSRKKRAKLLGDTIDVLKKYDQKDIDNALSNEGKAHTFIIRGATASDAAILKRSVQKDEEMSSQ